MPNNNQVAWDHEAVQWDDSPKSIPINLNPSFDASKATPSPRTIGATPEQQPAPDTGGFLKTLGGDVSSAIRPFNPFYKAPMGPTGIPLGSKPVDPTAAAQGALAQRQVAGQSMPRALTEGIAESAFGGNMQGFDQSMKSQNYSQALAHAIVPAAQAATMFRTGEAGTATDMPHAGLSGPELKAGVADATYKRGLGVAENLKSASSQIHEAVGQSAQSFISKVDKKFPDGAIDPKPVRNAVNQLKDDIVKTPERYPAGLSQMLEEGEGSAARALTQPEQLASKQAGKFLKNGMAPADIKSAMVNQGWLPKQVDAILSSVPGFEDTSPKWTAEEAKQWRTKVGSAIGKTQGPMKSVLTEAYTDLTQQMRKVADQSDALKDFQDYNNLHKKHMAFLNDPVVSKIMEGTTSKETLGPLADPEKMTHVQNILGDWDKYGVRTEDLAKEGADYGKAKALMEKQIFKWFPGGTLGGAVGAHMLGLPWGVGAGGGLLLDRWLSGAGKASKFIKSSQVSPFYEAGASKAADIARGWDEGVPEISTKKVALKKAEGK